MGRKAEGRKGGKAYSRGHRAESIEKYPELLSLSSLKLSRQQILICVQELSLIKAKFMANQMLS